MFYRRSLAAAGKKAQRGRILDTHHYYDSMAGLAIVKGPKLVSLLFRERARGAEITAGCV